MKYALCNVIKIRIIIQSNVIKQSDFKHLSQGFLDIQSHFEVDSTAHRVFIYLIKRITLSFGHKWFLSNLIIDFGSAEEYRRRWDCHAKS